MDPGLERFSLNIFRQLSYMCIQNQSLVYAHGSGFGAFFSKYFSPTKLHVYTESKPGFQWSGEIPCCAIKGARLHEGSQQSSIVVVVAESFKLSVGIISGEAGIRPVRFS